ncbi:hypothetical protein V6N13_057046 [Hibiscus sabdariffa]
MDKFPTEGLEGAPSKDIGWHFGDPVPNTRGHVICKLCGKVTKGRITRFKEHIAHKGGEVKACPNVTGIIRESMMKLLQETKGKKLDKRRREDEFLTQLRGEEEDEFFDDVSAMRQATREIRGPRGERSIPSRSEFNLREAIPELVKSKSLRQPKVGTRSVIERLEPSMDMQIRMVNQLLTFRGKNETFGTPQAQRAWSQMNPEWLQEKENPLLDGENVGLFPSDSSDDEINVGDQYQEQNLSDSSSSATPSQSGGDGQDSGTGGLSPIYDGDRESGGDRGEIRSSRRYGEEYGIDSASGRFCHMSEFGGNMSATPSGSRERSESRPRSKQKGKGTKMHTSEGSSSRRRSTSSNPGYTDSSTSTPDFYPPEQSSYSQPPHGYYPFPNYGMPMPYQPQMYPPPPMYQPPPPHMYPPPPMYQPPPPHMYPPVPPQLFENQGENVTFFGYIFGQRPQSQRSGHDTSQAEGEGEGGGEAYDLPRYSTNW